MKRLIPLALAIASASCHAEGISDNQCGYNKNSVKLITPTADNIANSFWEKDVDGNESIDRLFVNYKNGSMAVFEHKYCSMYNFEVAYYSRDPSEFSDVASLEKLAIEIFHSAAFSDSKTQQAITTMIKKMKDKKFDPSEASATAYDSSTDDSKRAEYILSYLPIEDSSIHKGALFIYMGIGGEH